jgi:glycine C-acetyltransferase
MKRNPTAFLKEEMKDLKENNLEWTIRYLEDASKPHSIVNGREVLMLNTNNYLGLATHPKIKKAMKEATEKYGAGAGAVPVIAGTFDLTREFEEKMAEFKEVEASVLCQTGFAVNSGVVPQLIGKEDAVISDELNHGSIIDGIRLTKADRYVYKHNDVADLEKKLKEADKKGARRILVTTDGVFSMDGDIAPLDDITEMAEEYGAMVFVDDCHGEGVLGKDYSGKGVVDHFGLQGRVHVEGGSMSKGFGVFGGTVSGSQELAEFVKNKSRTYLLSTAHPPSVVAACTASVEVVQEEKEHVKRVWDHTNYFKKEVQSMGYDTGDSQTPIIPLIIGEPGPAQKLADLLFEEENIYATPIVYPMVAKELSRIRVQMNALLTKEDLNNALSSIEKIGKKLNII